MLNIVLFTGCLRLVSVYGCSLQGKLALAISNYHKALGLRADDTFAADLLGVALREECEQLGSDFHSDLIL